MPEISSIQTVYFLSLFICVLYITRHSSLSLVQAFRVTTVIWKQQCRSKNLGYATQTQSALPNYNRNACLLSKLLGTRCSNSHSSCPDLWSSLCFVFSSSKVFLVHTDPRLVRQKPSSQKGGGLEAAWMIPRSNHHSLRLIKTPVWVMTHLDRVGILASCCRITTALVTTFSAPASCSQLEKWFSFHVHNTFQNNGSESWSPVITE